MEFIVVYDVASLVVRQRPGWAFDLLNLVLSELQSPPGLLYASLDLWKPKSDMSFRVIAGYGRQAEQRESGGSRRGGEGVPASTGH